MKEQPDAAEAQEAKGPADEGDDTANNHQEQDAAAEGDDGAEQAGNDQEQYGGLDAAANGGFQQNMMFPGGDFNQMQMMMAMQNGMGSNSFGGFPMMGKALYPPPTFFFFFAAAAVTDRVSRHARNGHGPDAEHVHERRLSRHGHERHGGLWRRFWTRLQ